MSMMLLARDAMRVRFELLLEGHDPVTLRAAGEEALAEIVSVEKFLNPFDSSSDLFAVNAWAAQRPVSISGPTMAFLRLARTLSDATGGAFDPTIAPLRRLWESGEPSDRALKTALQSVGMHRVILDEGESTVAFADSYVRLDPGALAKGWALERAADLLREAGVTQAILHGGTSSVVAIGAPDDAAGWTVGIRGPCSDLVSAVATLRDDSLSVSAIYGTWLAPDRGHIIDPRSGIPVAEESRLAVVQSPSAAEAEALSTALLVVGKPGLTALQQRFPKAVLQLY